MAVSESARWLMPPGAWNHGRPAEAAQDPQALLQVCIDDIEEAEMARAEALAAELFPSEDEDEAPAQPLKKSPMAVNTKPAREQLPLAPPPPQGAQELQDTAGSLLDQPRARVDEAEDASASVNPQNMHLNQRISQLPLGSVEGASASPGRRSMAGDEGTGPTGRRGRAAPGGPPAWPGLPGGGSWPEEQPTVGDHIRALKDIEPSRVLVVRRIQKLGFNSEGLLASYFSRFGLVQEVWVPRRQAKPFGSRGQPAAAVTRFRPGAMGFIVMADAACTQRILEEGKEQEVAGENITVGPFVPPAASGACGHLDPSGSQEPERTGMSHSESGGSFATPWIKRPPGL